MTSALCLTGCRVVFWTDFQGPKGDSYTVKRPPYFPLYVKDFAADPVVEAMSTEAVGAYILLLCKAWHLDPPASLPADDRVLARWARLSPEQWSEVKSEVIAAFTLGDDGRMHQKRLRQEFEGFRQKSKKRQAAAQSRWDMQKDDQKQCTSNANASTRGSGSESEVWNLLSDGLKTEKFRGAWNEWEAYRREIKKKLTKASVKKQIKQLEKLGHDAAIESIEQSIRNGWTGLFDPRDSAGASGKASGGARERKRTAAARREFDEDLEL